MNWPVKMFRLVSEHGQAGLCCSKDGLTLAGVPLTTKDAIGHAPRSSYELQNVFDTAYGQDSGIDADNYLPGLHSIARALNDGDLSRAMIGSLLLKLPDIDTEAAARLANAGPALKANFNWLEPRDHGEWTTGGGTGFIPVQAVPVPMPPLIYPENAGIGSRNTSDDDYANDNSDAQTKDQPKVCPDVSREDITKRDPEAVVYQAQITGLEPGLVVRLNNVAFDGCDDRTGNMLEAKKGQDWYMIIPEEDRIKLDEYKKIMEQAFGQSIAAGKRTVEWHFMNAEASYFWGKQFGLAGFLNLRTYYTPLDPNFRIDTGKLHKSAIGA
jgi:hypothetical protein